MWVSVSATVRSADVTTFGNVRGTYLKLSMDGGTIDATTPETDTSRLGGLLDAQVEVTGIVTGKFDSKMQLIGIDLELPALANVKVLKSAEVSLDSLPLTAMDKVLSSYNVRDLTHRVRVKGTITYYQPGSAVVLQNGTRSLWISTHSSYPMRIGDVAEATGFPNASEGFLALSDGEIRDSNIFEPVRPQPATWRQLALLNSGDPDGHQSDLVSFEGDVVEAVREDLQDEFVIDSNGKLFTAVYRHPPSSAPLPPMMKIPVGSKIRVAGICMIVQANSIDPSEREVPFNILLRSFDDISIIGSPPWLSVRHLMMIVGILLAAVLVLGLRGWLTESRTRRDIGSLAYVEQRRGRILESINSSEPLAEILERITELVSVRLNGAACWCQVADGAALGNRPEQLDGSSLRIVEYPIPARSGPPLGTIYAAFDARTKPTTIQREALTMAAGLATLAMETSRLYTDLVRRSEFDVLTDVQNRFAMERTLDAMIHNARQSAGILAMVFIDLNEFKQVNDIHGHLVGDLYLQEVAQRMKRQLRPSDMLARIGGDEFAVLVSEVRNRAEVEEIAMRLEGCFVEPFTGEGFVLRGSASIGIALYPEDATTADGLLSSADAARYLSKDARKGRKPEQRESDLASRNRT